MDYIELIEEVRAELLQVVNQRCDDMIQMYQNGEPYSRSVIRSRECRLGGTSPSMLKGKRPVSVTFYSYRESAKRLTVMKQENASDFDFKVLDMVLLGRLPYHNYFESFNTEDKEKAQRVLMARSITQEADILILDEPTNHLDVHYQWSIMEKIKHMGKTVLGVFHELNLASRY